MTPTETGEAFGWRVEACGALCDFERRAGGAGVLRGRCGRAGLSRDVEWSPDEATVPASDRLRPVNFVVIYSLIAAALGYTLSRFTRKATWPVYAAGVALGGLLLVWIHTSCTGECLLEEPETTLTCVGFGLGWAFRVAAAGRRLTR